MDIAIFIPLLFALQLAYWLIGRRASKNLTQESDYFLAGKAVRFFPLMMTFLATQVGGGVILGAADEAYAYGWPVLLYPMGAALGLMVLGAGIGRKLASFKVSTVAEILEVVYGSPVLKKIGSLLSIVSLFMILVAQVIGSSKFLVSMGVDNTPLFILFWAIVIIYTAQGGLKAVISTDMAQALVFSVILLFTFGFIFYFEPSISLLKMPQMESFAPLSSKMTGWLLMPFFFMFIEQDMGQRCFAADSPKTVSRATFYAGLFMLFICVVPVFVGTLAKTMGLEIPPGSSTLMVTIGATTTPLLTALVGCAVIAAIISTATSLINAIGSNVSNDFSLSFLSKVDPIRKVQIITCIISIGALFFSFFFNNIVSVLIQSYELSVSCLTVPILFALWKKKGHFLSALYSICFGALGFIALRIYPLEFPREIVSLILSLVGFGIGEWVSYRQIKRKEISDSV